MKNGDDVFISDGAEITRPEYCEIGSHVAIDSGFHCTTQLTIGDYVHISPHVAVIGGEDAVLRIGSFVFVSVGSKLICASEEFYGEGLVGPIIPDEYKDNIINKPIVFEDFSGVAANCVVMPGVTIGEGSVVGACSLVREDTEPWTIYYGTPARPFKAQKDSIRTTVYCYRILTPRKSRHLLLKHPDSITRVFPFVPCLS